MRRKNFQEGGIFEDEEVIDTEEDEDGVFSPTRSLVDELSEPSPREEEILGRMRTQADEVRASLQRAREKLSGQTLPRSQMWFGLAEALGRPTRTGQIGETLGHTAGALGQYGQQRREFEQGRDEGLLKLDTDIAGANQGVLAAELALEKIRQQQRARLLTAGATGQRTPAELATFEAMTANLTKEQKEQARMVFLGLRPRAGQFTMTEVAGQRGVRGVDPDGNPIFIPLSTQGEELGAAGAEAAAGAIGKGMGERYEAMQGSVLTADARIGQLNRLEQMLQGVETGTLTPVEMIATGVADYFGVELDPNLDAKQAAAAITARIALEGQRDAAGQRLLPGAMSEADRKLLVDRMAPSLSQTSEGRALIVDTQRKLIEREVQVAKLAREYRRRNEGIIDEYFLDELAEWAEQNPLFAEGGGGGRGTQQQLSPEQQAELDALLQQPQPPQARARGGHIRRRYQEGGRVITLSDGTRVAILSDGTRVVLDGEEGGDETESPIEQASSTGGVSLDDLRGIVEGLGIGAGTAAGAGAGLLTEEMGTRGTEALMGGPSRSERTVLRALGRDLGGDPSAAMADVAQGRALGVPETVADVGGPYTQALETRAITNASPEEAIAALDALRARNDASRQRVEARTGAAFSPQGEDYFAAEERLQNELYTRSKPLYEAAYAKYPALREDPAMTQILETPAGKRAVQYAMTLIRNQPGKTIGRADVTGLVRRPSLEFYDYVKRGFDQLIAAEEKGGPTPLGHAYREMRRAYRDRLDTLAPDEYKAARQQYAGDLEVRDALESGRAFHRQQPEELASRAQHMSQAETNAFRIGMGQRLSELIQSPETDRAAIRKLTGSPALMARLEPFFKPNEFAIFKEALEREADLFERGQTAIGRGESAVRAKAESAYNPGARALKLAGAGVRAVTSPLGTPTAFVLRLIADRPAMTEAESKRVLEVLRRNDPAELAEFARRAGVHTGVRRYRTGRRAGAAIAGAAAGTALAMDDDEE